MHMLGRWRVPCLQIFYGIDDIVGATDVIIVEGEMDKLAFNQVGEGPEPAACPSGGAAWHAMRGCIAGTQQMCGSGGQQRPRAGLATQHASSPQPLRRPRHVVSAPSGTPLPSPSTLALHSQPFQTTAAAAGYWNVVSVPSGAIAQPRTSACPDRRPQYASSSKFAFVRAAGQLLGSCRRFVLATDADAPGDAMAQALDDLLPSGPSRVRLHWHLVKGGRQPLKDANDALLQLGEAGLRSSLLDLGLQPWRRPGQW
jgi:hypothetical protein